MCPESIHVRCSARAGPAMHKIRLVEPVPVSTPAMGFVSEKDRQFTSKAIVRDIGWYAGRDYECISKPALAVLKQLLDVPKPHNHNRSIVIRLLDIYLQLTNQRVFLRGGALAPKDVVLDFAGALYSEKFYYAAHMRRFDIVATLRTICDLSGTIRHADFPVQSTVSITRFFEDRKARFESRVLNADAHLINRGWPVRTSSGISWLELKNLRERFGNDFAVKVQRATQGFFDGRGQQSVHQISFLIDYLSELPGEWSVESFLDSERVGQLFAEYALHFANVKGSMHSYEYVQANWTKGANFVKKAFFDTRVMVAPIWELTIFPYSARESQTHRGVDEDTGEEVSRKLFTEVPLKLNDKQAAQYLFRAIQEDLNSVTKWFNAGIADIWQRRQRFLQLASEGTVRKFSTSGYVLQKGRTRRTSDEWEKNVCATYLARGFETAKDEPRLSLLYGGSLRDVYRLIALPTAGALLPHMSALVAEHPAITPSFLQTLALYDKNDHVNAVAEIDNKWILSGFKPRKGAEKALQNIALSPRGAEVLAQVIELTQPLRDSLKKKGDPNWRLVFLESKKGFDDVIPVIASHRTSGKDNVSRLSHEFAVACDRLTRDTAKRLARDFSLPSLRAQVVVARYLEKPDVAKAAENLGHEKLNFNQVERYIPPPLLSFFLQRWVRLFQNAVLVEAMADSEFLLRATDLLSVDDLHEFMRNHALKVRPASTGEEKRELQFEDGTVYFAASVETMAALIALRAAVDAKPKACSVLATEWASFGARLERYVDFSQPPREELVVMMELARERAKDITFDESIYA